MISKLFRFSFAVAQQSQVPGKRSLLQKLQNSQQIVLTKDGYQVNLGLLIERRPILLKANKVDMEGLRIHYQTSKKYGTLPQIPRDLFEYDWERARYPVDEIPTHMRVDPVTEEKQFYHGNSKFYQHVDPNIEDPTSIQYLPCSHVYYMVKRAGTWEFPWVPVPDQYNFTEAQEEFFRKLSDDHKWNIHLLDRNPIVVHRREATSPNSRIKGSKTFYFLAAHLDGIPTPAGEWKGDYNWVPRAHLNKYVTREVYNTFVGALHL